jgi:hypothetical protein
MAINIPEFITKIIMLMCTYYLTLEYVFACEVKTWIGGITILICVILITVLYMIFRANKIKKCFSCGKIS